MQQIAWLATWGAANVVLISAVAVGLDARAWQDETTMVGHAAGVGIALNGALVAVPVLRRLLTRVRANAFGRVVPVDDAVTFHRVGSRVRRASGAWTPGGRSPDRLHARAQAGRASATAVVAELPA